MQITIEGFKSDEVDAKVNEIKTKLKKEGKRIWTQSLHSMAYNPKTENMWEKFVTIVIWDEWNR